MNTTKLVIERIQPNTPDEIIELERARLRGEKIECNALVNPANEEKGWMCAYNVNNTRDDCRWRFDVLRYRVAPPKPRTFWVNEYTDGRFGKLCTEKPDYIEVGRPVRRQIKLVEVVE